MTNGQIDKNAVSYMNIAINSCKKLLPQLKDNDKTHVWDGDIFIFGDDKQTTADVRKVPVQIKGTTRGNISASTIKFSVSKDSLQNFSNDGGVMFFIILMKDEKYKIFNKMLLPQDIKPILRTFTANQKKKSLEFKVIENKDMQSVMNYFIENRVINRPIYDFEDIIPFINKFTIKTLIPKNEAIEQIPTTAQIGKMLNDFSSYFYGNLKDLPNEFLPISKSICNFILMCNLYENPTINGKTYYVKGSEICDSKGLKIYIGANPDPLQRSIILTLRKKTFDLDVSIKGTLNQRITDIEFVIDIFDSNMGEKKESFLNLFSNLKIQRKLFDYIGYKNDVDISKFIDRDYKNLSLLQKGIEAGVSLADDSFIQEIQFSNLKFLLYVLKVQDGKFKLMNPYKIENLIQIVQKDKDGNEIGEQITISLFYLQYKQLFYKYSNTDYDIIYNSLISSTISPYIINYSLNTQLRMIEAFDDDRAGIDVLNLALRFGEWIDENIDTDKDCLQINKIQIRKRMDKVVQSDIDYLVAVTKQNNGIFRFAAYILLEDKENADKEFAELSKEMQKEFETYPIYTLYKKLVVK